MEGAAGHVAAAVAAVVAAVAARALALGLSLKKRKASSLDHWALVTGHRLRGYSVTVTMRAAKGATEKHVSQREAPRSPVMIQWDPLRGVHSGGAPADRQNHRPKVKPPVLRLLASMSALLLLEPQVWFRRLSK